MPTLSSTAAHRARELAESFGADAARYDRTRPRYPERMVEAIVAACPGPDVLDVGCGTGISARPFHERGCNVLGVDVDERMAAFARRHELAVEISPFETWDPRGRAFDAVISGQSWHWVDPVGGAAKAAGVLRPGGVLAVFWNVGEPSPQVAEAFAAVYRRMVPDVPIFHRAWPGLAGYSPLLRTVLAGILAVGAFGEPRQLRFGWEQRYSRDEWLDQVPTHGGHSRFAPAQLDELLAGIGDAIDAAGGGFTMRYTAVAIVASRR